jgi:site-specific DNA-methyltransferase (adenine-specific)
MSYFNNHPTIKPVELISHLVKLVSFENQIVLDPFMGSGSTGVTCLLENRQFVGYEIDKNYFEIPEKRFKNIKRGLF